MPAKTMMYKDESTGEKYKISWSEELQLKNLNVSKRQIQWQKINFIAMLFLFFVMLAFLAVIIYTLYTLDSYNFFTRLLSGR